MSETVPPTAGDWRQRLRTSRGGTTLVLAVTLVLVLVGAWVVRQQEHRASARDAAQNTANTVQLNADQGGEAPQVGRPAPGFTVTTMDGRRVSLASLKGHPVWITFGATWCTACRAEAPDVQAAWQRVQPKGVEVLAVFISEDAATVRGYQQRLGLSFPMVSDPDTTLASRYRSIGIPSHFFIDRDGILRASHVGGLTPDMMQQDLATIGV